MEARGLPPYTPDSPEKEPWVHGPIVAYPGYDVLAQQKHWDEATRSVVLRRVNEVPPVRFFDAHEVRTLQAVVDRLLPQDDRPPDRRIPLVNGIDNRCFNRVIDGHRYEDMPPDEEAWRQGLRGFDQTARALYQREFADLDADQQDTVLRRVADGNPPGEVWERMPPVRFWVAILMRQLVGVYYAHPIAWNEIGYGGPAYPRGYFALNHGYPEPWEAREVRLDAREG
jgi:hypothetical protein